MENSSVTGMKDVGHNGIVPGSVLEKFDNWPHFGNGFGKMV